jgi:uncharacterized protein (DUF1501 family)
VHAPERRSVSLAGLGLIGAGAMLGLALAVPTPASAAGSSHPAKTEAATVVDKDHPDR